MRVLRWLPHFCSVAALVVATSTTARADAPSPKPDGTIIAIDVGDLVVDIGSASGAHSDDIVEVWRPLRVRHPVTGQWLVDRFRIGSLRLTQVRSVLSLAVIEGVLSRPPANGDIIVLSRGEVPAQAPADPAPVAGVTVTTLSRKPSTGAPLRGAASSDAPPSSPALPPSQPPGAVDSDAHALVALMGTLAGSDHLTRTQAYEEFVRSHPKSRFARVLREEVAQLRSRPAAEAPQRILEPKLERVRAGSPQRFAVELEPTFVGAVVHVRRKGRPGYRSVAMESVGERYWAATLPGDVMAGDAIEYFVEGVPKGSAGVAVIGSAETPRIAEVDAQPGTPRAPGTLAQVTLQSEYASFNTKRANDYVWQTEGSVGWRLADQGFRAVRSGFGVLRGKGGTLRDLDELSRDPTNVGLTYGYVEAEVTLAPSFAVIGRPILGLRDTGISGGAQGFLRIGNDLRTNLALGGELLGTVGQRAIAQLEWRTINRFPIVLRTEITNQPASSGDVGARAIVQVGYQLTKELVVALRGSYQGRTINHSGPGAGLAVSYQW